MAQTHDLYARALQNSWMWPKHWQRQIKRIERRPDPNYMIYRYYVLAVNGGEVLEFDTPDEINEWASITDRMERS